MSRTVLLVDDERDVREALAQTLDLAGLDPVPVSAVTVAKDRISREFDGIVISDVRMPGKDGFDLLTHVQRIDPELPVILLTGHGDIDMAVEGIRQGAFEFLEKPCKPSRLVAAAEKALRARALVLDLRRRRDARTEGDAADRIHKGRSRLAEEMRARIRLAARSGVDVLVTGPQGAATSKVAEAIHLVSAEAQGPFRTVAATGLNAEALDAALDTADGGTLFIDEVAALPPATQHYLLGLLDTVRRARIVAGTHRDLATLAQSGQFNADLFHRLDVLPVRIPALDARREDIPELFRHYVAMAARDAGVAPREVPAELAHALVARDWPGNSRALMNEAMRFALGLDEDGEAEPLGLTDRMARIERSMLIEALREARGAAGQAAEALRLPRKTFYDKLARYGIRPEEYRGKAD